MNYSSLMKGTTQCFDTWNSIDIKTRKLSYIFFYLRVLFKFCVLGFTLIYIYEQGLDSSEFEILHDLLILIIFLSLDGILYKKKENIWRLFQYITEPLDQLQSNPWYYQHVIDYKKQFAMFGVGAAFQLLCTFVAWVVTSTLFRDHSPQNSFYIHLLVGWIPNISDSSMGFPSLFILSVLMNFFDICLFYFWIIFMALCVLKVKLITTLICVDLSRMTQLAEDRTDEMLDEAEAIGNLPYCDECLIMIYANGRSVSMLKRVRFEECSTSRQRDCCKSIMRDAVRQEFLRRYVAKLTIQHLEVIKNVHFMDETFKMFVLVFNQFTIIVAVLPIHVLRSMNLTTAAMVHITVEPIAVLVVGAIFTFCGQTVLDMGDDIRWALYDCHWEDLPVKFRRNLLIMQTVANKPFKLTSGGIHTLSWETYLKFLNATISYMFFIMSMKE